MIYRCSLCDPPCILSIHGTPKQSCPNSDLDGLCAWVAIKGVFLSEVPA